MDSTIRRAASAGFGHFIHILPLAFLLVLVNVSPNCAAEEPSTSSLQSEEIKRTAVVYLIDNSTSMQWIFDDLKTTLKKAIKRYNPEDCVSIILFGTDVTTLASYDSMDATKAKILSGLLDAVNPTSLYTNFAPAVDRSTKYLHDYYRNAVADDYRLVLVTDGKDHPPPGYTAPLSLEEALTQFPDFLPGQQWTIYYIALKGQIDQQLLTLVGKYRGRFFDAGEISTASHVTEKEVIGSIIENTRDWEVFTASIVDHEGEVWLKRSGEKEWQTVPEGFAEEMYCGDQVSVSQASKAIISLGSIGKLGLREETEMGLRNMQKSPLEKAVTVQLDLENGALWNAVKKPLDGSLKYEVLTPIALTGIRGTIFRVAFDRGKNEQNVAVVEGSAEISPCGEDSIFKTLLLQEGKYSELLSGKEPMPPRDIPLEILREWAAWVKALVWKFALSHINFSPVQFRPLVGKITLGPLKPKVKYQESYVIELSEKYYGNSPISAVADITLPPGVEIDTNILESEKSDLIRILSLSLKCPPFLRYTGTSEYVGKIRFRSSDSSVKFTRDYVDLEITHLPPSFLSELWDYHPLFRIILLISCFLITLGITIFMWKKRAAIKKLAKRVAAYMLDKIVKTRLIHIFRGRPVGHLVPFRELDISRSERFDLARVSRLSNRIVLSIGAGPGNQILIPDTSLKPVHCAIHASRKKNPTRIYLENRSDGNLTVNEEHVGDVCQLKHKDVISIGRLKFKFLDVQYYRQVRLRMTDGTVREGILEYWDLNQSVFYMTQMKGESEDFQAIRFKEVSYVHFYKDESAREKEIMPHPLRSARKKKRKKVTVTLDDGRKIQGFVDKKYHHKASEGLFLWPLSEQSKVEYTYIPRFNIDSIFMMETTQ